MSAIQCERCMRYCEEMEMGHLSFVLPPRGESRYVHLCAGCYDLVRDALIGALRVPKGTVQTTLDGPMAKWKEVKG